ncbi:MAG: hypothetical protein C0485_15120 [Pirellula sp.]|nr:hypothetical protein [Pirellula sp.]
MDITSSQDPVALPPGLALPTAAGSSTQSADSGGDSVIGRQAGNDESVYQPFPVEVLPTAVRNIVVEGAAALGCDEAMIALPALVACGGAIGASRLIRLKSTWLEPATLWGVLIAESGGLKTPGMAIAVQPLKDAEAECWREFDLAVKDHERKVNDASEIDGAKGKVPPPVCRRVLISDATLAALAPLLSANPRGLTLVMDEIAGWFSSFNRFDKGGEFDVSQWLSVFNGEGIIVDRKTAAGPIRVARASVSIVGGIQPGVFTRVVGQKYRDNGMAARLLKVWPLRRPKRWTVAEVSPEVLAKYREAVQRLLSLLPVEDADGKASPRVVELTPGATEVFSKFVDRHGEETETLTGHLAAEWSKLEAYAARIALVFHCMSDAPDGAVTERTMNAAIELVEWFKHESKRIYSKLDAAEDEERLRTIVEFIRQKGGRISARELQNGRRSVKSALEAEAILKQLYQRGYGVFQVDTHDGGPGRPVETFILDESNAS